MKTSRPCLSRLLPLRSFPVARKQPGIPRNANFKKESSGRPKPIPGLPGFLRALAASFLVSSLYPVGSECVAQDNPRYSIYLEGVVSGWPFARTGELLITPTITHAGTTNGVNHFDLGFVSGTPWTNAQRGAIAFATNNRLLGGPASLDLVRTSFSGRTLTIDIDGAISQASQCAFNATNGGIVGYAYQIAGGRIVLHFSEDFRTISGTIQITGRDIIMGQVASYAANLYGQMVSGSPSEVFGSSGSSGSTGSTGTAGTTGSARNGSAVSSRRVTRIGRRAVVHGAVHSPSQQDRYRFRVRGKSGKDTRQRGERVRIWTEGVFSDTYGILTQAGRKIASNRNSGHHRNFQIVRRLPRGIYQIAVGVKNPNSFGGGRYTLRLR